MSIRTNLEGKPTYSDFFVPWHGLYEDDSNPRTGYAEKPQLEAMIKEEEELESK